MARKISAALPNKLEPRNPHGPGILQKTYEIKLITPLFGGGVEAGENDPITLIRPPSIRGQLRFWWRATRGAACETVEELRQREAEIWGSTEIPSPVTVNVEFEHQNKGVPEAVGKFEGKKTRNERGEIEIRHSFVFAQDIPGYAAFPARPQYDNGKSLAQNNDAITRVRKNITFRLCLDFPKLIEADIETALKAWVNFGGLGARTRRGWGALYCEDLAPESTDSLEGFLQALNHKNTAPFPWPLLYHAHYLLSGLKNNASASWQEGISKLQAFRQSPPIGRQTGTGKKHGRSNWPEAEAVRNLVFAQRKTTGMFQGSRSANRPRGWHDPDAKLVRLGQNPVYFPCAEFGLPIIWEIKDESLSTRRDNLKPTLQYDKDHDRLASPLIIRPIQFKDGVVCALFLRLRTPPLDGACLKPGDADLDHEVKIASSQIHAPALSRYQDSPLGSPSSGGALRSPQGSALEAFFEFLKRG
jgi:CRISPR-associated protein Cmr1